MDITDCSVFFGSYPKRYVDGDIDNVSKVMKENGIGRAIVCSLIGVTYDYRAGNRETLSAAQAHPWMIPAATVNPLKFTGDYGEFAAMKEAGFSILRLVREHQGWPIDFMPTRLVFECAAKAALPVAISTHELGDLTKLARQLEGIDIPVIASNVYYSSFSEAIVVGQRCDRLYFDVQRLNGPHTIEVFVEQLGTHRLVYGSNTPFDCVLSSLLLVQKAHIGEECRRQILSGNIEKIIAGHSCGAY